MDFIMGWAEKKRGGGCGGYMGLGVQSWSNMPSATGVNPGRWSCVRTLCQHWSENNSKQSWYEIESCVYLASLGILVLEKDTYIAAQTQW